MEKSRWYAVTTKPRHEKVVAERLQENCIETFLPTASTVSQWKDRKVVIQRPLFPGYVFTHVEPQLRTNVYGVPGVMSMVCFNGRPAEIDANEIEAIRLCVATRTRHEPHPYLSSGESVRVKAGALAGLQGIVVRHKNRCRIVVTISLIHKSLALEIDSELLEPLLQLAV